MRPFALLALAFLALLIAPPVGAHGDTVFHYISESGDYIGKGQERTITPASGFKFQVTASTNHVGFYITGPGASFSQFYLLDFSAPSNAALAVTSYPGATRYPFQDAGQPGLDFSANGSGSNTLTGEFKVLEVTFDGTGTLATFAADFVQHSEGAAPASYGEIRYNSAIPYISPSGVAQLAADNYSVFETAGSLTVTARRFDGSTGPLTATFSTADGTDLAGRDYTAVSGKLNWADGDTADKTFRIPILNSGNPEQGNGTFFVNLSGASTGPQTQATVTVVNDNASVTFVHFVSQSGDFIGQGQERTFSIADGYVFTVSRNSYGGVSLDFNNNAAVGVANSELWYLDFSAATGGIFGVGDYEDAERYPFQTGTHPGLSLSGDGRGSNTLTGNFQVLEASFDGNGNVLKYAANFVQHSEGATPALIGQVRYNSTVPLPELPGTISFSSAAYSVVEGAGAATITATRTGGSGGALSVSYATSNGSAIAGTNYIPVSGTLSWADGDATPKTFTVSVRDDGVYTTDLSLTLQLTGTALGSVPQASLTIVNKEPFQPGMVQFSGANYQAKSSAGTATITVNRTGGSNGFRTVAYASTNGTAVAGKNYSPVSGSLVWADGDTSPKSFQVPLLDPVSGLASQTVLLSLSGSDLGPVSRAILTINNVNFPAAGTLTFNAPIYSVKSTAGVASITVARTGGSFGALSVNYATSSGTAVAGTDYKSVSGILRWADGDSAPKRFDVPLLDPVTAAASQTVFLTLTGTDLGAFRKATLTIVNANFPAAGTVSFSAANYAASETDGAATITVNRTGGSFGAVSVSYATADGSAVAGRDYTAASGTLVWADGDSAAKTFTVPILDAKAVGGTRSLVLTIAGGNLGALRQATLTIADNDLAPLPTVSVFTPTPIVDQQTGLRAIFLVSRSGDTSAPLTVSYKVKGSAKSGVDYKPVSGEVTIPAGAVKAKVKLKLLTDPNMTGTLIAKIKLLPSMDGTYDLGDATIAKVKLLDNH